MTDSKMDVQEAPKHPLLVGTRITITTWTEWKKAWDEAPSLEARLGLLHVGFNPGLGDFVERFCFYLDVANGYASTFFGPIGSDCVNGENFLPGTFGNKSLSEALHTLAEKALTEVVKECFQVKEEYPRSTFSAAWLASPIVIDKIIWFIKQSGKRGERGNLEGRSHAAAVARKFFLHMIYFSFEDLRHNNFRRDGYLPDVSELLFPRRAELIPALNTIGDVYWLLKPEVIDNLDDACTAGLTKLALGTEAKFPGEAKWRVPATIEEASYLGVHAAQVLVLHQTWKREKQRLEKHADLLCQKAQIDRQLAQN